MLTRTQQNLIYNYKYNIINYKIKLIIQKNFFLNSEYHFKNYSIMSNKIGTIQDIARLNENGFIKPLSLKELVKLEQELKQNKKTNKEEEKQNGSNEKKRFCTLF